MFLWMELSVKKLLEGCWKFYDRVGIMILNEVANRYIFMTTVDPHPMQR